MADPPGDFSEGMLVSSVELSAAASEQCYCRTLAQAPRSFSLAALRKSHFGSFVIDNKQLTRICFVSSSIIRKRGKMKIPLNCDPDKMTKSEKHMQVSAHRERGGEGALLPKADQRIRPNEPKKPFIHNNRSNPEPKEP